MNEMNHTLTTGQRLGYIGLGSMGAPMAMRLAGWPGGLVVFDVRDEAMAAFALGYAEQNDADYQALLAAIAEGRITADSLG